jgi:hypothetical protein
MISILGRVAAAIAVILLAIAVIWQTVHLIEWCGILYDAYGGGTVASYLRMHAYTYVTHIFGDSFGWTVGGA